MVRLLACMLAASLCGCGTMNATVIRGDAIAFNDAVEDVTNKLLVRNILRARDKAPLYFADIPSIRQSMSQTAGFSVPGFLRTIGIARESAGTSLGLQFSPSFEVSHLHSREFHTGIASPIDAKIVKYWLDRGLDRRIVLLLFFSSAEIVEARPEGTRSIRIMNSPREALEVILARRTAVAADALRCDSQSDFERYLKLINALRTFFAHAYRERRLIGGGFALEPEKDPRASLLPFATLDPTKVQLVHDRATGKHSLYALGAEQKVAFCVSDPGPAGDFAIATAGDGTPGRQACFHSVVDLPPEDSSRRDGVEAPMPFAGAQARSRPGPYCSIFNRFLAIGAPPPGEVPPRLALRLNIRSVGEIFQFLGDLLHYQDELQQHFLRVPGAPRLNTPVTFGYCPTDSGPGCDDVFLRLDGPSCNARFSLDYRGRDYGVGNFGKGDAACAPDRAGVDHTLEILSVLHQLVGLHRSAAELRQTPAVQVVP